MDKVSIAVGAVGVAGLYFLYLAASKGLPAAYAWVKAKWSGAGAEFATLKADFVQLLPVPPSPVLSNCAFSRHAHRLACPGRRCCDHRPQITRPFLLNRGISMTYPGADAPPTKLPLRIGNIVNASYVQVPVQSRNPHTGEPQSASLETYSGTIILKSVGE